MSPEKNKGTENQPESLTRDTQSPSFWHVNQCQCHCQSLNSELTSVFNFKANHPIRACKMQFSTFCTIDDDFKHTHLIIKENMQIIWVKMQKIAELFLRRTFTLVTKSRVRFKACYWLMRYEQESHDFRLTNQDRLELRNPTTRVMIMVILKLGLIFLTRSEISPFQLSLVVDGPAGR